MWIDELDVTRRQLVVWKAQFAGLKCSFAFATVLSLLRRGQFNPDQPRDELGRWTSAGGIQFENRSATGNRNTDGVTDQLLDILADVLTWREDGFGPAFGTLVHSDFANAVRSADIEKVGILGVEWSFSLGDTVAYGLDGSVRTDVVLQNDVTGEILAVWDLKTGSARLTAARVDQIRSQLGLSLEVPVIELHVTRRATVKATQIGAYHVG